MLGLRLNIYSIWISNIYVNNFKKFAIFFIKKNHRAHIAHNTSNTREKARDKFRCAIYVTGINRKHRSVSANIWSRAVGISSHFTSPFMPFPRSDFPSPTTRCANIFMDLHKIKIATSLFLLVRLYRKHPGEECRIKTRKFRHLLLYDLSKSDLNIIWIDVV